MSMTVSKRKYCYHFTEETAIQTLNNSSETSSSSVNYIFSYSHIFL